MNMHVDVVRLQTKELFLPNEATKLLNVALGRAIESDKILK